MADVQDHVILFLVWLISFILARALFTKYRTRTLLGKAEAGEAVDVKKEIMRLTNNLITKMIMRHRCSDSEDDATEGFKKRVKEARARFDAIMERVMKAREEERRKKRDMNDAGVAMNDFLDILLDIMENEKEEMRLTRENVKASFWGTETSGTAAIWAVAELINHPNIMEKARQEIDSVVGKGQTCGRFRYRKLPYLQAIVKEILRLHPPGALIARESTEDCTIGGYHIPAKTQLFVNVGYWKGPKLLGEPTSVLAREIPDRRWESKESLGCKGPTFSSAAIWEWKENLPWSFTSTAGNSDKPGCYDPVF
ncbi:Cytochrome P450 93A2 [Vitis vinifera]|uniref:Cytochrome P450 93A2 n=1 Tax=Vitis vinifera TaxID=29760 RepID=A0A438EGW5_VITVI|nr:Cytochrome P450 93A2 [Vitis vinifera]